ncbi:hypothetical protein ACFUTV_31745 [Streptomyces sp. NPDC057298]|uniref:hypothetical protein n=1 Tax=Streptomyces sp. NPDC057298 TaxID=3346091 RepID=UPI003643AE90
MKHRFPRALALGAASVLLTGCGVCIGSVCGDDNDGNRINSPASPTTSPTTGNVSPSKSTKTPSQKRGGPSEEDQTSSTPNAVVEAPRPRARPVSMQALCRADGAVSHFGCDTDEADLDEAVFTHVLETNPNRSIVDPNWDYLLKFGPTSCTRITVRFTAPTAQMDPGTIVKARLVQEGADAVEATAVRSGIGSLTAKLTGGPFRIEGVTTDETRGVQVVANGTATCTSDSGR